MWPGIQIMEYDVIFFLGTQRVRVNHVGWIVRIISCVYCDQSDCYKAGNY